MDDGSEHKKAKRIKKAVVKNRIMFENFKDCLITKLYKNCNKHLKVNFTKYIL